MSCGGAGAGGRGPGRVPIDGLQPLLDRPSPQEVMLLGAGPAGDDDDVGRGDLVESGVGDEGQAPGVGAHPAAPLVDHDHLRAGQPAEDLGGADGVEDCHVVVGEDGDLHRDTVGLRRPVPHRASPLRSV